MRAEKSQQKQRDENRLKTKFWERPSCIGDSNAFNMWKN
jgi:hypothetical protein